MNASMTEEERLAIVEWLGGRDTGLSSKAVALTALGRMPQSPSYPHDGDDLGRIVRLLDKVPAASNALPVLAKDGGEIWGALVARWDDLVQVYRDGGPIYELIGSIIRPIENASGRVVRLSGGASIHFGGR